MFPCANNLSGIYRIGCAMIVWIEVVAAVESADIVESLVTPIG
jgi:hypothetical protein